MEVGIFNPLAEEQNGILSMLLTGYGIQVMTCGNCGSLVVVDWRDREGPLNWKWDSKSKMDIITCWSCGYDGESADFPDVIHSERSRINGGE